MIGQEKIDRSRSYIVIANHQSLYDIPGLMLGLGIQIRWVIKKSFIHVPFFGWALYLARHVFIERANPRWALRTMRRAVEKLPPGCPSCPSPSTAAGR